MFNLVFSDGKDVQLNIWQQEFLVEHFSYHCFMMFYILLECILIF